jgi:hypothetical protein
MEGVYIARKALWHYSNGRRFDSHAPTQVRRFENHTWGAGYPHSQATASSFKDQVMRRDDLAANEHVYFGLVNILEHIINPVCQRMNIARGSSSACKSEASSHVAWF